MSRGPRAFGPWAMGHRPPATYCAHWRRPCGIGHAYMEGPSNRGRWDTLRPTPELVWKTLRAETAVLHSRVFLLYRAHGRTCAAPEGGASSHRCTEEGCVEKAQSLPPLPCRRWSQARPLDEVMRYFGKCKESPWSRWGLVLLVGGELRSQHPKRRSARCDGVELVRTILEREWGRVAAGAVTVRLPALHT